MTKIISYKQLKVVHTLFVYIFSAICLHKKLFVYFSFYSGYKFTLVEEITKDFGKAFGCDKEAIRAFVNQEVKP